MSDSNSEFHYTVQFANRLWLSQKLTEAWQLYFRALNHRPLNGNLLFHLGTLSHNAEEYEKAVAWFSLFLAQGKIDPRVLNNLGESFRELAKYREARKCYQKALELSPELAQLHNNFGLVLYALGDLSGAEASFRTAISLLSVYPRAHRNLARVLQDQGKSVEAAEHFHKSRFGERWPRNLSSSGQP